MHKSFFAISFLLGSLAFAEAEVKPQATSTATPATENAAAAADPFAFADFGWLNGNSRQTQFPLDSKYFTGQLTVDTNYVYDFNHPSDHTLIGSTNSGRTNEFQVEQLGVGGDFHYEHIRARLMTQFGMYSTMTPRNDATPSRGQWDLSDAYRYLSEAYGGYHWDVMNGINLDVGIFMSYIGLCSYYNYENWVYQMSYVSANTPWFFNGMRLQVFPSDKFKAEFWLVNGWQSYGMANESPGIGTQLLWRPNGWLSFVSNEYYGADTIGTPGRERIHSDDSVQVKYYDKPASEITKAAFSLTVDAGCENGGGVQCTKSDSINGPAQYFLGIMAYNRVWFNKDKYAVTIGGGAINNPGRYLVLVPPINGATQATGSYYFPESAGLPFHAWDSSVTFDYMPSQFITFRLELDHREADVPYFAGSGGITPSSSFNTVNNGPANVVPGYQPDLANGETRINAAMMVRL